MKKFIATYLFLLIGILAFSQEETSLNTIPNKKVYFTDPAELILQFSQINIQDNTARNGIRASYFTNVPYYMFLRVHDVEFYEFSVFKYGYSFFAVCVVYDYLSVHFKILLSDVSAS